MYRYGSIVERYLMRFRPHFHKTTQAIRHRSHTLGSAAVHQARARISNRIDTDMERNRCELMEDDTSTIQTITLNWNA